MSDRDRNREAAARESVGNNARGTDAHPTGPEGNERQRPRGDRADAYDDDLARDDRCGQEGQGMDELARDTRSGMSAMPFPNDDDRHGWRSHARQGQAESPVELNQDEQPKDKEGHR